jgi:tetratricopeptide (TPR) repeat protein
LAHNNLGNALATKGQKDEALACYREAVRIKPDFALAHNNLGKGLWQRACATRPSVPTRRLSAFTRS